MTACCRNCRHWNLTSAIQASEAEGECEAAFAGAPGDLFWIENPCEALNTREDFSCKAFQPTKNITIKIPEIRSIADAVLPDLLRISGRDLPAGWCDLGDLELTLHYSPDTGVFQIGQSFAIEDEASRFLGTIAAVQHDEETVILTLRDVHEVHR